MLIVTHVMALFAELDKEVAEFQLKTGLRCQSGCGRCCLTTQVHTTVAEMLPVAGEILRESTGDYWLAQIRKAHTNPECVLYQNEAIEDSPGHCRFYAWRPGVCRLFGFASVHTRAGGRSISICKPLKTHDPASAEIATSRAAEAPCLSDLNTRLYGIDPSSPLQLFPINEALRLAIERMGLYMQMAYGEKMGSISVA